MSAPSRPQPRHRTTHSRVASLECRDSRRLAWVLKRLARASRRVVCSLSRAVVSHGNPFPTRPSAWFGCRTVRGATGRPIASQPLRLERYLVCVVVAWENRGDQDVTRSGFARAFGEDGNVHGRLCICDVFGVAPRIVAVCRTNLPKGRGQRQRDRRHSSGWTDLLATLIVSAGQPLPNRSS